jgi:hypothetical protein
MASKEEYTEAIKTLTKKTDQGEVRWESYDPSGEVEGERKARDGYRTKHKDRELRLYKEVYDREVADFEKTLTIGGEITPGPSTITVVNTVLRMRDPKTGGEWTFPKMSILDDLHSSVEQTSAGVQEWMSEILDNE